MYIVDCVCPDFPLSFEQSIRDSRVVVFISCRNVSAITSKIGIDVNGGDTALKSTRVIEAT
jgi:hypothetical protein